MEVYGYVLDCLRVQGKFSKVVGRSASQHHLQKRSSVSQQHVCLRVTVMVTHWLGAHCERQTQHECTDGSQSKENSVNSRVRGPQSTTLRPTSCSCHTQYIYSFIIYLTHWNECSLRIETAFFIRCCILYA